MLTFVSIEVIEQFHNDVVCASVINENNMEGLDFQTFGVCKVVTRSATQFGKESKSLVKFYLEQYV